MYESGLLFRMGPNCSYLSASEFRSMIRGTEFSRYQDRVTTVVAYSPDASHHVATTYIESAKNPSCFRLGGYDSLKTRYRLQKNGWMDSNGFKI